MSRWLLAVGVGGVAAAMGVGALSGTDGRVACLKCATGGVGEVDAAALIGAGLSARRCPSTAGFPGVWAFCAAVAAAVDRAG